MKHSSAAHRSLDRRSRGRHLRGHHSLDRNGCTAQVIGIFPQLGQTMSDRLFMLATAHRTIYSVIASYLIARLAPDRPMRHALAGGVS